MEAFMALIASFGFNYAPYGWMLCNGQQLSVAQNSALFALLGTMYGGNGSSNFNLPDLRGRAMIGMGQGPGLSDHIQGINGAGGTENSSALVAHTHAATLSNASATVKVNNTLGSGGTPTDRANVLASSATALYNAAAPNVTLNIGGGAVTGTVAVNPAGTVPSFSIMQPYLPINFSIATQGIFPSRN
jgi:microcystin-dependent protein